MQSNIVLGRNIVPQQSNKEAVKLKILVLLTWTIVLSGGPVQYCTWAARLSYNRKRQQTWFFTKEP
jgi:hypothetical protein